MISPSRLGVLAVDHVALRLAEALAVDLAGGLRGDAPELGLGHVLGDADLGSHAGGRVDLLCGADEHLELGILDLVGRGDDLVLAVDADLAGLRVDAHHDVLGGVGIAAIGGFDRLLQGLDQDLLGNALLSVQLEQGSDEVPVHIRTSPLRGRNKNVGLANRPTLHS